MAVTSTDRTVAEFGAVAELAAMLAAAEASLRAVAAAELTPAALIRAERRSSRMAAATVARLDDVRRLVLPASFPDLVEIDAALDELLDGFERARTTFVIEPSIVRAARSRDVPEPPIAVRAERPVAPAPEPPPSPEPAWAEDDPLPWETAAKPAVDGAGVVFRAPATLPDDDDDLPDWAKPVPRAEVPAARPEPAASPAWTAADEDDEDERTAIGPAPDRSGSFVVAPEATQATPARASATAPSSFVHFEEEPDYAYDDEDGYDDPYADPGAEDTGSYVVYTEPDPSVTLSTQQRGDDEPLPAYAAPPPEAAVTAPLPVAPKRAAEPPKPAAAVPVAAPPPAPVAPPAEEWTFQSSATTAEEGRDRYATVRNETMRLDEVDAALDEAQTTVLPRRSRADVPRGPAAAILLGADGPRVLGAEDEDPEADELLELGDTRDYGDEEEMDDDDGGILGVGVVEYDDDDSSEADESEDDSESALARLPGAPRLTPADVAALLARAATVGKRDLAAGVELYTDALDAEPERLDALVARGRLSLDLGDYPSAISDFLRAETIAPRDANVQVALGDLFYSRKDYNKAVSYFNRALSTDADHAAALAKRGMAHFLRRQFAAAVEDLERAKKLDRTLTHVDTYIQQARRRV